VGSGGTQAINAELAELSALKTNHEGATRNFNNQFARLAERLDRIERAETERNAKLAHVVEAVDRLQKDRRSVMASSGASAAVETTGGIPNNPPIPAEAGRPEKVLPDWILHAVRGSRALVENRHGDVFEISAGSVLPGLGRVEAIKRQGDDWVVVTARGIVASAPSVIPAERVQ
jgi:Asp-tRNA(Asn)/Glu-tRNA(Gln) amidotransferase C subunit